ncbi:MAG: hypothetical protein LC772_12180 [Chloroflexi bacterium]|nr:hypothetical protein [Chloroflexota bacterium]
MMNTKPPPPRPARLHRGLAAILGAVVCLGAASNARAVTGAEYRRLADTAAANRQYAEAARDYRLEAQVYRSKGDLNGAQVEELKADRWTTRIDLYAEVPYPAALPAGLYTRAKFEPPYGCYVGAYVASDDSLAGQGEGQREELFSRTLHKQIGTFFDYCRYGEGFPTNWARALTSRGLAPHIAWEPNDGMDKVQDDAYLEQFARDAAACGGPVFLRFAGEMNGDWTVYHRDPALYRAKFRLVHDVMARLAPNVAMIWCVNHIPETNMDDYYPGDDAVDWVGVNFYSVIHHDNDPARPADFENPATMLEYVYRKYSSRKPIAICEYGASHREQLALGTDLFDCNNLEHARAGRQLNDYSVTDSPVVLAALTSAIAPAYFLTRVANGEPWPPPPFLAPLESGEALSGVAALSAIISSYDLKPEVVYSLDDRPLARLNTPGTYLFDLDTARFPLGKHTITVDVYDSRGVKAGHWSASVVFRPAPPPVRTPTRPAVLGRKNLKAVQSARARSGVTQEAAAPNRPGGAPGWQSETAVPTPVLLVAAGLAVVLVILALRLSLRRR